MSVHAVAAVEGNPVAGARRGKVVEILPSGEIGVHLDADPSVVVWCDFLETIRAKPLLLQAGDPVLVMLTEHPNEKPVILGKIGVYRENAPKQVVLEADDEITIRCGKGAIVIRESGKILLKGVDIVSNARQRNRIRGGSVQIN